MNLIKLKDLSFAYNNIEVISQVNLTINEGDYIYIVGENGAGKSTLLRGILGLKKPSQGQLIYSDLIDRKEIGYIPQQKNIKKDFPASVEEIVLSGRLNSKGRRIFYSSADREVARENMKRMNILDLRTKPYRSLSGGQQQRVLLARALCATKKLLILDEPDTGLDIEAREELYSILDHLNTRHKISIVIVTHDLKNRPRDGSYVYLVKDGQVRPLDLSGAGTSIEETMKEEIR